jgi:sugar lactone lactonase YvrE
VRRLRADGIVESVVGTGEPGFAGDGGPATSAQLAYPAGLAFDAAGSLYIADSSNNRVRKVTAGVIATVLGTGDPGATLPNQLNLPTSVAIDSAGNLDVADSGNQRVQQLTPAGTIGTLPGVGRDLAPDSAGDLFIASGAQVLELAPSLTIQTVAGDGSYGFRGDDRPATSARLSGPVAVAVDAAGALYLADQRNSRLRMVTAAGVISTIAGDGTAGAGDGQLNSPAGVAVDSSGAVYVADQNNDRIQQIVGGSVLTLAGTGVPGFNGDGLPGSATQLFSPGAMALSNGTLYFGDTGNARLRAPTSAQPATRNFHPG